MPTLTMPATSTQPVQQQVLAISGGVPYNFSADQAYMAFVPQPNSGAPPDPESSQWNSATIEVDAGPTFWVSCLVGPANGGIVLAAGSYAICVKVVDDPSVPVLFGWTLQIV